MPCPAVRLHRNDAGATKSRERDICGQWKNPAASLCPNGTFVNDRRTANPDYPQDDGRAVVPDGPLRLCWIGSMMLVGPGFQPFMDGLEAAPLACFLGSVAG
jgi:hypothetical protein